MNRQEYRAECGSVAETVFDEYDCDPYDALHEIIDGHEWLVYTRYHLDILRHSTNADYASEEGLLSEGQPFDRLVMASAFYAFMQDVMETTEWSEGQEARDAE